MMKNGPDKEALITLRAESQDIFSSALFIYHLRSLGSAKLIKTLVKSSCKIHATKIITTDKVTLNRSAHNNIPYEVVTLYF